MKPIKDTWCIQIDITNYCVNKCSNCTHLIPHFKNPKNMKLDTFIKAVESLKGFKGLIGIIGGEPTLNPMWRSMLIYLNKAVGKDRTGFWTCRADDLDFIRERAGYVNYNPHTDKVSHSPVLVASGEIISDTAEREKAISNCWLAEKWSPGITEKGLYRCEVMGAMDMILNKNLGVDPIHWDKDMEFFKHQVDYFCNKCGVCLNLKGRVDAERVDDISRKNYDLFLEAGSPRIKQEHYNLVELDNLPTAEKEPWKYIKEGK